MNEQLQHLLQQSDSIVVQQVKEWLEVLSNFETVNKYEIVTEDGDRLGFAAEDGGWLGRLVLRLWLKRHRPLEIHITSNAGQEILQLHRPFYFLFSTMTISEPDGTLLGRARKRFGIIYKKYSLYTADGQEFAQIRAPFWEFWTFYIRTLQGDDLGTISKRWGGFLKELFTDADRFHIDLPPSFTPVQRAIVLASALSIDLDYFEENFGRSSS